MTSSTSPSYTPEQMEEIRTRITDLRQSLTTKLIGLELRVPRGVASQLLEDFLSSGSKKGEECCVSRYVKKKKGDKTVIKLETTKVTTPYTASSKQGSIYSITLLPSTQKQSSIKQCPQKAHEFTSASLRDLITTDPETALDSSLRCDAISLPNKEKIRRVDVGNARRGRVEALASSSAPERKRVMLATTTLSGSKNRKATTAASFFGRASAKKKETTQKKEDKKESEKKKDEKEKDSGKNKKANHRAIIDDEESKDEGETKKSTMEKTKKSTTKNKGRTKQPKSQEEEDDDDDENKEIQTKNSAPQSKKATKKRKTKAQKEAEEDFKKEHYGNADDFVGDEDEDDDYLKEEEARKKRNALAARKQVRKEAEDEALVRKNKSTFKANQRRRAVPRNEDGDAYEDVDMEEAEDAEKKEKETVFGEMDSFLQRNKDDKDENKKHALDRDDGRPTKRRRKKLVQKTTMGEDGYLHTETLTVWEDVPDEEMEEEEKKESSPKASGKNHVGSGGGSTFQKKKGGANKKSNAPLHKKNMKQTGLMGFFAKKN